MFEGDRRRKSTLVEHGFRLPSALDNRPLRATEFWRKTHQAIFVSATPGKFERELCLAAAEAGPDPVAQARDLVLLSNAAKVSKLEKAMQEVRAFFCRQHLQHSRTTTHSNAETTTRLTQPAGHRCVDRIRRRTLSGWSSAVA